MARQRKKASNLAVYAGRWVAFSNNRVVAVGPSLPEVMRKIATRPTRLTPSVFLVPRRDEGPYVLVILPTAW